MSYNLKKCIRVVLSCFFIALLAFAGFYTTTLKTDATQGTFSIQMPEQTIAKETTFTVQITVDSQINMHSASACITYDPTIIEWISANSDAIVGNSGTLTLSDTFDKAVKQKTYELTFKAIALGNGSIDVTEASINTHQNLSTIKVISSAVTYTVITNDTIDSDCSLSELIIGCGELSPKWNRNTYEYTVNVPADTEIFAYSATPASDDAVVTSTGPSKLSPGNNTYVITVTAPSGEEQKYTLTVVR